MTTRDTNTSGKRSEPRNEAPAIGPSESWRQTLLWPLEVVQFDLRAGWDRRTGKGMWSGQVTDPTTHELVALEVQPFRQFHNVGHFITCISAAHTQVLRDVLDPDPF